MPIIKSAKKKLRQDKKKQKVNSAYKVSYKKNIKEAKKDKTKTPLSKVYSSLDKAAKKGILHRNKVVRLKSQAAKREKRA